MIRIISQTVSHVIVYSGVYNLSYFFNAIQLVPEAEFKEFEPRLKFETPLKYGWFH